MPRPDGQLMRLEAVPSTHIDAAWADGASELAQACKTSGGEITGEQLKMILSRGERSLFRLCDDENTVVGWAVARVDQLPNMRVLFVTDLVAPNGHFERFYGEVKELAKKHGCSRVRCAAQPAQERLYSMKLGMKPVYTILEATL